MDASVFDPATAKLGGVLILTVHMTIMAQLKQYFTLKPKSRLYDMVNYPLAFLLVLPVLPPWPVWAWEAWAAYVSGAIGLAVLASVTAQKTRDTPSSDGGS